MLSHVVAGAHLINSLYIMLWHLFGVWRGGGIDCAGGGVVGCIWNHTTTNDITGGTLSANLEGL